MTNDGRHRLQQYLGLTIACCFFLSGGGFDTAVQAEPRQVTLLYTNDIESVYEPVDAFWTPDIEKIGGIPYLATLIAQQRAEAEISFLLDAGDIYTGALSQTSEGRLAFDLYSLMGYDALNLGNHEFEYGWQSLRHVQQRASFPVLTSNLFYEGTDIPFGRSYAILEKEGLRVGVIGSLGVDAFINTINPAHSKGLEVRPVAPIVQQVIDRIQHEVDLVVVLTHQNRTAPMQTDKEADPEVQRGFDEDYALAGTLRGAHVILGGHSDHGLWQPVQHPETGVWISQTFGQGKYLGRMRLQVDPETGHVELLDGQLLPVESNKLEPNETLLGRIRQERLRAPHLTQVIGSLDGPAVRRYYRESNIGNLLADILRQAAGTDIAVMNSGSLRADLDGGDVTAEEMLNVYPFIGPYHVVELDAEGVRALLEHGYALHYGLAQLSGIEAVYDSRKPPGERLVEVTVGGQPLNPEGRYTVVSSEFLARGGDDYHMLRDGKKVRASDDRLVEAFLDHFRSQKTVHVPPLGRQRDMARETKEP